MERLYKTFGRRGAFDRSVYADGDVLVPYSRPDCHPPIFPAGILHHGCSQNRYAAQNQRWGERVSTSRLFFPLAPTDDKGVLQKCHKWFRRLSRR